MEGLYKSRDYVEITDIDRREGMYKLNFSSNNREDFYIGALSILCGLDLTFLLHADIYP